MKKIFLIVSILGSLKVPAQNVGIGTTAPTHKLHVAGTTRSDTIAIGTAAPRSPLSFGTQQGQKITLYDDGNAGGNNYGIGVQTGLLQFHTYTLSDNISFGYGKSTAMTERMRIINSGGDGLLVNGRITLKNGTNPLDISYSSGIWMYKADNTALLGFMGVQNNQNLGFYGGPAGWGFTYDAINSRVGIGNNNPNAPLAFPSLLGKKITLYPGATGDVGFAVAGNRLQIYSDNPNADVAIGYDAAGTFNERFAVKANGALAVYGNTGTPGQVVMSNGPGSNASWTSPANIIKTEFGPETTSQLLSNNSAIDLPASAYTVTLLVPSRVILLYKSKFFRFCSVGECASKIQLVVYLNGQQSTSYQVRMSGVDGNDSYSTDATNGPDYFDLPAGTHTFTFTGRCTYNPPLVIEKFRVFSTIIPL